MTKRGEIYFDERIPKPRFKNLEQIDRIRNFMLGLPVRNRGGPNMPWGYEVNPKDSLELIPIDHDLRILRRGREYLKTCSMDEVCLWVNRQDCQSKKINKSTLFYILETRPPLEEVYLPIKDRGKL